MHVPLRLISTCVCAQTLKKNMHSQHYREGMHARACQPTYYILYTHLGYHSLTCYEKGYINNSTNLSYQCIYLEIIWTEVQCEKSQSIHSHDKNACTAESYTCAWLFIRMHFNHILLTSEVCDYYGTHVRIIFAAFISDTKISLKNFPLF